MDLVIEQPTGLFDKIFIEALKERKIYLNQEIDPTVIEIICATVRQINWEDTKKNIAVEERTPIEVYISSPGGSVYDGFAAVNAIITSKTPVHTYCEGYAMSMGLAIFAAGHKRFAYPYTTFMYHEVASGVFGKNIEIERQNKENKRIQTMYDGLLISQTEMKKNQLDKVKKDSLDWFFDAEEALKMGLVHEVIK